MHSFFRKTSHFKIKYDYNSMEIKKEIYQLNYCLYLKSNFSNNGLRGANVCIEGSLDKIIMGSLYTSVHMHI